MTTMMPTTPSMTTKMAAVTTDPQSIATGADGRALGHGAGLVSIRGLRSVMLGAGAVALPVVLAVVTSLLTAGSLDESVGRLPQERPSVTKAATPIARSPHTDSGLGSTNTITASAVAGNGSTPDERLAPQESDGTGSGGVASSPFDPEEREDDHPEGEPGGGDD